MHTNFNAVYDELSDLEKVILTICCIISEPAGQETLAGCLYKLHQLAPKKYPFSGQQAEEALRSLQNRELLTKDYICKDNYVELICRKSQKNGKFSHIVSVVQKLLPTNDEYSASKKDIAFNRIIRDLRIHIYNGDIDSFHSVLLAYLSNPLLADMPNPVAFICNSPFEADWFSTIPLQIQLYALNAIYRSCILESKPLSTYLPFLEKQANRYKIPPEAKKSFIYLLIIQLIITGNIDKAAHLLERHKKSASALGLKGSLQFLTNKNVDAIQSFEEDLALLRKNNDDNSSYFTGLEGLFYIVAMLKSGNFVYLETVRSVIESIETLQPNNLFRGSYTSLRFVLEALENRFDLKKFQHHLHSQEKSDPFSVLFSLLAMHWITGKIPNHSKIITENMYFLTLENDFKWLLFEFANLMQLFKPENKTERQIAQISKDTGFYSLTFAVTFEEPWQRALKALLQSTSQASQTEKATHKIRLCWNVAHNMETGELLFIPKEQRKTDKGAWTKGRSISLKKLFAGDYPAFLTSQDKKICASLKSKENPWGVSYHFDLDTALPAIIGHPYIFLDDKKNEPVEFIKGAPELLVNENNGIYQLRFYPEITEKPVVLVEDSPTRYKVYEISDEHRRVAYIIGEKGLNIPEEAKEEVLAVLGNVSSFMTVHSEIHGQTNVSSSIEADSTIYVHLNPYSSGLRLSLYVKPFRIGGPYLKPGRGASTVIAEIDGNRLHTLRNMEQEVLNINFIEEQCPTLALCEEINDEWIIHDPERCLEVLLELQNIGKTIVIEWPEGEKFTVSRQISTDQLHIHIRKKNDWFQVDGELSIDEKLMLDMRKLLELTKTSSSRFIPIGDGQFLTLTEELRKRIDDLHLYADQRGKSIRISPLAAVAFDDFSTSGIQVDTDKDWQEQIKRIQHAKEYKPEIPSTFQAEFRDYQTEGFNWLSRMAYWGVGACLADDMGLGKTVQALAAILERAPSGPTLVVAPTSVCLNWLKEANRFAPTLNVKLFTGKQRQELVKNLKEFDMLIVSYALLQQEADLLCPIQWQTIVLDEAQAIKNMSTKRSKAAMSLQGDFKIITTGTPIENHLGELWNLFQFINPGLLGSYRQFVNRYMNPIERHQNRNIRKKLKKLIRPFILRRIKSQVLDELPPRTEITLQVEMSPREAALYEALRQQAIEKIKETDKPGRKHLTILAEITRLRRACCNPILVVPGTTIKSSKMALFIETIEELLESRHKALIFSQFVDHLSILRRHLDQQNISYRYIDGSTPAKQRQKEVDLFQSGSGDLFLISLKAGGLGLNLTAADYVIHMDPWWNPAVEDQASDRAHRIGQQHPVTVYRFVTQNTIEEKIITLHQEKRELADSLLEGADISDKISADELLELLQSR